MNHMDHNGLYDIYSVWHVPFWQTGWFYWTIACLIAVICIASSLFIYRWYKKRNPSITTPWAIALESITSLQGKRYTTQQEGKQCYFELTRTLKTYLQNRFAYPIACATDEQAARYLERTTLDHILRKNIQEILRGCLLIKFANQHAVDEQIQAHLALAKESVLKTIPQPTDQKSSQPS